MMTWSRRNVVLNIFRLFLSLDDDKLHSINYTSAFLSSPWFQYILRKKRLMFWKISIGRRILFLAHLWEPCQADHRNTNTVSAAGAAPLPNLAVPPLSLEVPHVYALGFRALILDLIDYELAD